MAKKASRARAEECELRVLRDLLEQLNEKLEYFCDEAEYCQHPDFVAEATHAADNVIACVKSESLRLLRFRLDLGAKQ